MELLPLKACFSPSEPVEIAICDAGGATRVSLWQLDRTLGETLVEEGGTAVLGPLAEGGYGVEAAGPDGAFASTAFDVLVSPMSRPRYGFVAGFEAGRDPAAVVENVRRLHLNAVQFYDWMYRHAQLLPPDDTFRDALGRELSLATTRSLASALRGAGSLPLGYTAVYAVGKDEWPEWKQAGLYRPDGATPWTLGDDFLWLVDPADERWSEHFATELEQALEEVGFAGFHLDQYGWPRRALRHDGTEVELAAAFPLLIGRLRARLPLARLVFNNVNDFPTSTTAGTGQDAVYIEVWPPHDELGDLAGLIAKARALAPDKAPILAAYQSVYGSAPADEADCAARFEMATVFSRGGFQLLLGEEGALLTGPYYPDHQLLGARSLEMFRRWYDFVVRHGDLLFDRDAVDVTGSFVGGINDSLTIEAPVAVSADPEPGALWVSVVETRLGTLIHLINLSAQTDLGWDRPKRPVRSLEGVRLSMLRTAADAPTFAYGDPDGPPRLEPLPSRAEAAWYDVIDLPPLNTWGLVWIHSAASAASA